MDIGCLTIRFAIQASHNAVHNYNPYKIYDLYWITSNSYEFLPDLDEQTAMNVNVFD